MQESEVPLDAVPSGSDVSRDWERSNLLGLHPYSCFSLLLGLSRCSLQTLSRVLFPVP